MGTKLDLGANLLGIVIAVSALVGIFAVGWLISGALIGAVGVSFVVQAMLAVAAFQLLLAIVQTVINVVAALS